MNTNSRIEGIVIIILLVSNVFFGFKYFSTKRELVKAQAAQHQSELNDKIIDFTSMFIKDVLKANQEVNFETRLALETNVRNLNDPQIMTEWQNFTASSTEAVAQENVKKLLETLISKIKK